MFCPFCNAEDTRVIDSRLVANGTQVRRRRECVSCKERYTSFEVVELAVPKVIKKGGDRVPFDENKLRVGLQKAIEKRAISAEQLEAIIAKVVLKLRSTGEREVDSLMIGSIVMDLLVELDIVAYIRFASVYWGFEDLQAFKEFINNLEYSSN